MSVAAETDGASTNPADRGLTRRPVRLLGSDRGRGGEEVKWLGDGLMVAFPSAADAVRAAVAMQQASARPVGGERLAIRVGLNAGEALQDSADWFGTPVVVARRLCDTAGAGQILCAQLVVALLEGRSEFSFSDLGASLREAMAGRGGLVLVAGEPGIGKTRLVSEFADRAAQDALVLWGHCYERDWTPPYAPFTEALESYATAATPDELQADVVAAGPAVAQLAPRVRDILPDLAPLVPLPPDEERIRLFDAAAQFLAASSARRPLVVCVDDLHWADRGTVGLLRHVARLAARRRLLIVGTYRDAEIDDRHPLGEVLTAFARETTFDRLRLDGLDAAATAAMLGAIGGEAFDERVGRFWARETSGNPFFIGELVRHLTEEGTLYQGADGRWTTDRPLRELSLPETVRDVVARRVSRLPEGGRRFLSVASAFEGPCRLDVVARVAELHEDAAIDAADAALAAGLLEEGGAADTYLFHHALIGP